MDIDQQRQAIVDAWNQNDLLCRNYVFNSLDNTWYNIYCQIKSIKELHKSLDKKCHTKDVGMNKFIVSRFFVIHGILKSRLVVEHVRRIKLRNFDKTNVIWVVKIEENLKNFPKGIYT